MLVRDEAAAVRVREQEVVVLGEESRSGPDVRVGTGRVGQVEQLASALVAERSQTRAQSLEDVPQPGEPRPGRGVGDRRRAERAQVAQNDVVDRRLGVERPPEPRLRRGRRNLAGSTPDAARRHLDEGEEVPAGVGERTGSCCGKRSASRARSSGAVRGRSSNSRRPNGRTAARSTPSSAGEKSRWRASSPSSTGCISGRSRRQSAAVTRCRVARISTMRTTRRSSEKLRELLGIEAFEP